MPDSRADPTPQFVRFAADDPDFACERLRALYGPAARVGGLDKGVDFAMRMQAARLGGVTLSRVEISNWTMARPAGDSVVVIIPLSGPLQANAAGSWREHEPNRSFALTAPAEEMVLAVGGGVGMALTAPAAGLVARAEQATGKACGVSTARIGDAIDAAAPAAQALARTAKTAMAEIASLRQIGLGALAVAGYQDLLLNLLTATLFPEIADPAVRAPDCGGAVVRDARDFLREHAREPIEISRLAADLGVSMRALQQNFHRSYGQSPRDYLAGRRLELARDALLSQGRGLTVTDIALASGFSDLSHFSTKYREKYGELPSQTLRSA